MKLDGQLLEVTKGEYLGSPYASIKLRSEDVANNQILKYKLDLKKVNYDDVSELLDKKITVTCDVVKGANDSASLKVVSVE